MNANRHCTISMSRFCNLIDFAWRHTGIALFIALVLVARQGWADVRLVDTAGSDTGDCTGTPCLTISYAISQSNNGDTIQVAAGTYTLSATVDVNKSVTLLGAQHGVDPRPHANTTRVPESANESIVDAAFTLPNAFMINADNVTIDGFEIRKITTGAHINSPDNVTYDNAQIRYNIIHHTAGNNGNGIRFKQITNSIVEYNDIYNVYHSAVTTAGGDTANSRYAKVRYNEIHDLGSGGSTNAAIYAYSLIASDIDVTIEGNRVYNHAGDDAIKVGAKQGQDRARTGGSVINNIVYTTAQDCITINASNTLVQGNEVYGCGGNNAPIYAEHANTGVIVKYNNIHDNTSATAAILLGDMAAPSPTGHIVQFNRIQDNTKNLILFRDITGGTATLDASTNWWGANDEATVSSRVKSIAKPSTPTTFRVDYTPWINDGTDTDPLTPGYQPDLTSLTVAPATVTIQTAPADRIQEAVDLAQTPGIVQVLAGSYSESFTVAKAVNVELASGSIVTGTAGISTGGSLTGLGNVSGGATVSAGGHVAPGLNPGTGILGVGNATFTSGASFDVEINGTNAGSDYDVLSVSGTLDLGGAALNLTLGYQPITGDAYTIIDNQGGAITGTFSGLPEAASFPFGGRQYQITYVGGDGNDVVLTDQGAVPPTFTPTNSPTDTPTETPTSTATDTPTMTPTPSASPTITATATPTAHGGCAHVPAVGCQVPVGRSAFAIHDRVDNAADSVTWRWTGKSTVVLLNELGNPLTSTRYSLCVYDETGGVPSLVLGSQAPAGGTCGSKPCWKATASGFRYQNKSGLPDGIKRISLNATGRRSASARVIGRGLNLLLPAPANPGFLHQDTRVIVQLQKSDGPECWEVSYTAPAQRNMLRFFRDRYLP